MNFLIYIFLLCSALTGFFIVYFYTKKLKVSFVKKLLNKNFINKAVYCSLALDDICSYILKAGKKKQYKIINSLSKKDLSSFKKEVDNKKLVSLISILEGKNTKIDDCDTTAQILKAKYYLKTNKQDKALKILQNLSLQKASMFQKIYIKYLTTQMSAYEGDMLPASEDLNTSIAFFKKKNMYFEEAEAYYLLGNIHRISGIYDTAEFMLRTSLKIYSCIESAKGQAEVLGTLGLLMCVQNRFEEACDYYNKAYKTAQGYRNLQEFIVVQQTMLDFLKNDKKQAVKRADKILKSTNNKIVKASILDILSRISISEKKYIKAAKYSFESSQEFFTNKNYPAGFEAYYLYASALFEGGKFNESEQVLRDLIKKEKQHPGCFHIANAYTLLGLVLLKNKEFDRAKAIFNQSLSKEFYNNRKTGVAIDYANLAVVEKSLGNNDESVKNIEKALSQIAGIDDELYNKIKVMLD